MDLWTETIYQFIIKKKQKSKPKEAVLQDHVEQQMEEHEDRLVQYVLLTEAPYRWSRYVSWYRASQKKVQIHFHK